MQMKCTKVSFTTSSLQTFVEGATDCTPSVFFKQYLVEEV